MTNHDASVQGKNSCNLWKPMGFQICQHQDHLPGHIWGLKAGPQGCSSPKRYFLWNHPFKIYCPQIRGARKDRPGYARLSSQVVARFQHLNVVTVPGLGLPGNFRTSRERVSPTPEEPCGGAADSPFLLTRLHSNPTKPLLFWIFKCGKPKVNSKQTVLSEFKRKLPGQAACKSQHCLEEEDREKKGEGEKKSALVWVRWVWRSATWWSPSLMVGRRALEKNCRSPKYQKKHI